MTRKLILLFFFVVAILISQRTLSQPVDTTSIRINTRLSFYSYEKNGEFLLHIPTDISQNNLSITIKIGKETIASWYGKPGKRILRILFTLNLTPSVYKTVARIIVTARPDLIYKATTKLIVLSYKPNEVKTDRLTGGLIVNRMQFFPFGFYCYSPVYPTLPEEEVVKGFNMMSPYQKIVPETLEERKAYMDRCAEIGMKVNYNLLSVSGGGGVGSKIEGISDVEKRDRLITEIETFRDHPALLGWYISDEPNGYKISPDHLEKIYRTIKENDPRHPVSIVFMTPFLSSKKYSEALDIVMADPYPVPDSPVTVVGEVAGQLMKEFGGKRPVWMAQQSFGGGEIWSREPTLQEVRSMTWQAIIKGATGIQYFVRQGLNYFPKSAATWSECGRMAVEVAELTPWLLSDEETLPVESNSNNIIVSSRLHNGQLIVMAVNKINEPVSSVIRIRGFNNGRAGVLFENRSVPVSGGLIKDYLAPFGSQVYLINIKPEKTVVSVSNTNLIKDPGFEDLSSPGIPSACYARPGGDRGATYFLDTREHYEGNHSVRIITPEEDKSVALRFFPFRVKAGTSYTISIWAKSDPEQRFFPATNRENNSLYEEKEMPQYVEILLGGFAHARFVPDSEWRQYVTFVTIPNDTLASFKTNLILKMPGQGVAWFDELKVYEEK
ncbi:MAG: beta-galactosidase [Bacteroidota bacterium]